MDASVVKTKHPVQVNAAQKCQYDFRVRNKSQQGLCELYNACCFCRVFSQC